MVGMSLVGCRDFSNVRKLGENSKEIAAKSQEMATDYYQSCLRRARVPIDTFPDIANTRAAAEEACRQNDRELGMAIADANQVIIAYLNNLMMLADNRSSVITPENQKKLQGALGDLSTSLSDTSGSVPEPVSTILEQGSSILNVIFDAVAADIRGDTIPPVMVCTDEAIDSYTQGLIEIASVVYVNQLQLEADQHRQYFGLLTPPPGTVFTPSEALSLLRLDREYNEAIDKINEKKAFAEEFVKVLDATRGSHKSISLVFAEKLDLTKLNQEKQPEIDPLKRDAFCAERATQRYQEPVSIQLTPSDVSRIVNILKDYERTTAPMIEKMKRVDFKQ
ncbi:hypothetical protein H6F87_01595 [Cyanobacteria bacterium FACHB-502]|nr:hypothetical protein [Cyanobacteria bacterium FACHB-502]